MGRSAAAAGNNRNRDGDLLATKLHAPRLPEAFVPRPRLIDVLDASAGRFVVVCAPAGFGKSALLADWASRGRSPIAWVSLDEADNDPARFWRHLTAALERVSPGIEERLAPLFGPPAPTSFVGFVTALINELARTLSSVDGAALVLDDLHVIDSPPVVDSFAYLVEHRPANVSLLVGSRIDPPLPLARLRARGELTEVRAEQLRFAPEEAAALLRGATGVDVPGDQVAILTARTEGWAAGLQLAGLSLRGEPDPARFVADFSGSHRFVLDYLTEEVLERQPTHVTDFLLQTSLLDRLTGPLCNALTGRSDGQEMLERLEQANLFVVPLDNVQGWWRYHHLFADLLRARLQHRHPDQVAHLHEVASVWHEEHGFIDSAVHHAAQAGNVDHVADLVERHADELLMRSEGTTIQRWLSTLAEEVVTARPRLLLVRARLSLLRGQTDEADAALDAAERALTTSTTTRDDYEPSVGAGASLLANVPATIALDRAYLAELRGDADAAATHASAAMESIRDGEWMLHSHAGGYLALARWQQGRLAEAEQLLVESIAQWRAAGEHYLAVRGCHHLGQIRRAQGRPGDAADAYRLAIEVASRPGAESPAAGVGHVGLAELAYQQGDLDRAQSEVERGIALCRHLAYVQPLATGLATLAWIQQARGEDQLARTTMEEAVALGPMHGVTSLLNPVPAQWARLRLTHGDVAVAAAWTRQRGIEAEDDPDYAREPDYLVLARVLLAQGAVQRAESLLNRLHEAADAQQRSGSLAEIVELQSAVLAARTSPGSRRATHVPGLVEQLTARELEVLQLLATGQSNRDIATSLFVGLDTVKKHVSRVLDKLGASNRTEAVARARDLNLVP
ncbi:MAG TPA: LuxR C-terminal-related transcriptional regulator [Micromonosporaceae bacterium]|nr:LuxR C-terminal-related transcriptional regulator [Micromonosporaceae bacterium]